MLFMAAVGLTLALMTVDSRRKNDYRVKRNTSPPPTIQTPGSLAGLGFLPENANVVAALQIAEILKDPIGKKLLESPRPPVLGLMLGTVEKWTNLKPADLDCIVLGTQIKDKLPQLTMVVETNRPYNIDDLSKALNPTHQSVLHRGQPLFRFGLNPGEGMLWCALPRTLIFLFRIDGLKMADLEALPLPPRTGTEAIPRTIQGVLKERINKQSLMWMAGEVGDLDLFKELLPFVPLPVADLAIVSKIKSFGLSIFFQDDLVLVGHFQTSDANSARLLQKQLEGIKIANLKSLKVETAPIEEGGAERWITLQMRWKN